MVYLILYLYYYNIILTWTTTTVDAVGSGIAVVAELRPRSLSVMDVTRGGSSRPWRARSPIPVAAEARATARRDFERKINSKTIVSRSQKKPDGVPTTRRTSCRGTTVSPPEGSGAARTDIIRSASPNGRREKDLPRVRYFLNFFFRKPFYDNFFYVFRACETSRFDRPGRHVWRMRCRETACGT